MMYNRLYFLHIHKTGGTFFDTAIIKPEKENLLNHGIDIDPVNAKDLSLHWGWHEDLTGDNSYIITTFRDPVERLVSHFCDWQKWMKQNITNEYPNEINRENFFRFLNLYEKPLKNYQSKVLLYNLPEIKAYIEDEDFINLEIDKELLYQRLDRINLMIRSKDLQYPDIIKNKLFSDLSIVPFTKGIPLVFNAKVNPYSKQLLNSITPEERQEIYFNNDIDTKIYVNNKYFFMPDK